MLVGRRDPLTPRTLPSLHNGFEMQVKSGAVEGAAMNVRVNGVAPGFVRTGMTEPMGEEAIAQACRNMHLTKKVITTDQVHVRGQ